MKIARGTSWIENLTEMVAEVENSQNGNLYEIREIGKEFYFESIEICQTMRDALMGQDEEDEEDFLNVLIQSSQNVNTALARLDRSAYFSKDDLTYEMYRFISLLSQRINFGTREPL